MNLQQQKKVLSLLDVLGSTIVDIFYNHMYDRAIAMKERTENNITTCYKTAIVEYTKTRDSPEFYKTLINSVHYYTRISTIYNDLSFVDCINLYASLFIPEVYIKSLTEKQKHDVLSMVLRETIKTFSDKLMEDYLAIIIDEHDDPTNIPLLQDSILKELVKHRDHSYTSFISCERKNEPKKATTGIKVITKPTSVPKILKTQKTLSKLNKLYKQAVEDKNKLKGKHIELQTKYNSLVDQSKELQNMLLNQIKLYKDREIELNTIKKKELSPRKMSSPLAISESPDYDGLFAVQYNE
jgi:hypothetical protein